MAENGAPVPSSESPAIGSTMGQQTQVTSDRAGEQNPRGQSGNRGNSDNLRKRKREVGRKEWSRNTKGKNTRRDDATKSRRSGGDEKPEDAAHPALPFSQQEIEDEERRPKAKVAVMMGYSGTGYKGMQINVKEKTIEGDLFAAFVAAGAISKANSNDPKKSSLVRCARTDKGVHAAGNMISLKLIIEDADIVKKINSHLPSQIRVWGIQRTVKSFSCYRSCDSRIYEYLIPTYAFLPPHPRTYLAKKIKEIAEEANDTEGMSSRQEEVAGFWDEVETTSVAPLLAELDVPMREAVLKAIHDDDPSVTNADVADAIEQTADDQKHDVDEAEEAGEESSSKPGQSKFTKAVRAIKAAYMSARKGYRIHPRRLERIREVLELYLGTRNYHNYTVDKAWRDPSSKRHMKSFVADEPIIIGGTEWVSLKVHGQSFMMHQIRKMVSMMTLIVRSGCPKERLLESFASPKISIPKAPGVGLLLERPVFDTYNGHGAENSGRSKINYDDFADEIKEFKQREIYDRIFWEEESSNHFHVFFTHVDRIRNDQFLYLTSGGIPRASRPTTKHMEASEAGRKVEASTVGLEADKTEVGDGNAARVDSEDEDADDGDEAG
ncbi:MAG: tRNA pseudouridine synthase 1 [Chaenotheca gracillima]|nr:MAG: tRNA pseudouridine synthase 1 [Chaenotheca gracillima]